MNVNPFPQILEYFSKKFGSLPEQLSVIFSNTAVRIVVGLCLVVLVTALIIAAAAVIFNAVLWFVSTWRMFRAAGEGGWKSLIPFYNQYIFYKITWSKTAFWVVLILSFGLGILNGIAGALFAVAFRSSIAAFFESAFDFAQATAQLGVNAGSIVSVAILYVFVIFVGGALFVLDIISRWHLSKAYNHGFWYFAGLIVFPKIFYYIIGLDSGITYTGNAAARKEKKEAAKSKTVPASGMILDEIRPEESVEPAPALVAAPEAYAAAPADPQDPGSAITPEDAPNDPENP